MGYESRLYVIKKSTFESSDSGKRYGEIVAMFDLCKVSDIDFSKYPETEYYIYAENGDKETIKDKYGDPLRELTLEQVVKEIEDAMSLEPHYRRFKPCLSLLREFKDTNLSQWGGELAVLHYGY